jgi:nicotinamide-nucleotide amidase
MIFSAALTTRASELLDLCRSRRLMLATAESCTGGLIAALLTSVPGSSDVMDAGFVTYSNAAKTAMIGVPPRLIAGHGAVSAEVARAMAQGALANSQADIALAVTGVAGPGGGTPAKPVGLVHLAAAARHGRIKQGELRLGDIGREGIRLAAVTAALDMAYELADCGP